MTGERLFSRRELLEADVLPKLGEPIRASAVLDASLRDLIHSVKAQLFCVGFFDSTTTRIAIRLDPITCVWIIPS